MLLLPAIACTIGAQEHLEPACQRQVNRLQFDMVKFVPVRYLVLTSIQKGIMAL